MCAIWSDSLDWIDTETGEIIGTADFTGTQDITFSSTSEDFDENFELQVTAVDGELPGATLNLSVACTIRTTCQAFSNFPNGTPITQGQDVSTQISYSDTTSTVDTNSISYTLSWGPDTITPITWASPSFRCDNVFPGYPAGCVVPAITPILTTMTQLPAIAANIAAVQQAGPHHYGLQGEGSPLTRNSSLIGANRAVACPGTPPAGLSCDEYPFASTDQGASQTQPPDWGTALVPVAEQNSQGGLLSSFYNEYRVMDGTEGTGDAFWVSV